MRRREETRVFRATKRARSRRARAPDGGAHNRKTTMKAKPNYAELEKRIDFTALAGRLGQLSERDNPQRKTVFTLLDKPSMPTRNERLGTVSRQRTLLESEL